MSHAGGPWGFTFGTRLGPIFWAHENIGCYVPKLLQPSLKQKIRKWPLRSKVHLEAEGLEASRKKRIEIGATAARSQQSSSHFDSCFATIKPAAKKSI